MPEYQARKATVPAFMVICEGECDQICGSMAEAKRERKDLIAMGNERVTVRKFDSWQEAEAFEDKLRGL